MYNCTYKKTVTHDKKNNCNVLGGVLSLSWVRRNASGGASSGAIGSANISVFSDDSALGGQGARQVVVTRQADLRVIAADNVY